MMLCKRVNCKVRLAILRIKDAFARGVWQIKPASFTHAGVVIVKSRHHVFDNFANLVVIASQVFPINRRAMFERCARQPGYDLRFTQQLRGRRVERATRQLHYTHRVLRSDNLWTTHLEIDFRAAETRQDQRAVAGHHMRAI